MESTAFPWLSSLSEDQAHDFITKLGIVLGPDYDEDEESPSWEQVLAHVDGVVHEFKTLADAKPSRPQKSENHLVRMTLTQQSLATFGYTLDEAPEFVSNDAFPGGGVRPETLLINCAPDTEGVWSISMLVVGGPPVVDGVVKQRKRGVNIPFMDPLGEGGETLPVWLREIAQDHVHLMNRGAGLKDRQQQAARKAASEILAGLMLGIGLSDEVADKIFTAIQRVG